MLTESTQHKLDRVRPPRVQITYDVEIGDAIEMKELPFVAGIMADLSGKRVEPLPKVKDRKFVDIDRDNFNEVLGAIKPHLDISVENKLQDNGKPLNVKLNFKDMENFSPVKVLEQVDQLKKLFDARQRLSELLTKLDGNDELDSILQDVIKNTDKMEEIAKETSKKK